MKTVDIKKCNKKFAEFIGMRYMNNFVQEFKNNVWIDEYSVEGDYDYDCWQPQEDWTQLMLVVDYIEKVIEHSIEIQGGCQIIWWYSTKKKNSMGDTRTPFDSICGKYHCISVGVVGVCRDKIMAESKIMAVYISCSMFIDWYIKNEKNKKCLKKQK